VKKISLPLFLWVFTVLGASCFSPIEAITGAQVLSYGKQTVFSACNKVVAVPKSIGSALWSRAYNGAVGFKSRAGRVAAFSRSHPYLTLMGLGVAGVASLVITRVTGFSSFMERSYYGGQSCLLHNAAFKGDVNALRILLLLGLDVNSKDIFGRTPLHCAILANSKNAVKFLMQAGADIDKADHAGDLPLHYAVRKGHQDILDWFASSYNDVNAWYYKLCQRQKRGERLMVVQLALLEGNSQLFDQVFQRRVQDQNLFLGMGGDVPRPLLNYCAEMGYKDAVVNLLSKINSPPQDTDSLGRNAFFYAVINGHFDIADILIQYGGVAAQAWMGAVDTLGKTVLHEAFAQGNIAAIEYLLSKDDNGMPSLLVRDPNGVFPITNALLSGFDSVVRQTLKSIKTVNPSLIKNLFFGAVCHGKNIELVQFLLDQKFVKLGVKNDQGDTAWDLAVKNGHLDEMKLLVSKGVDINKVDAFGNSYLLLYVTHYNTTAVHSLLELGADPNIANKKGQTPILEAIDQKKADLVEELVKKGADLCYKNQAGETPLSLAISTLPKCSYGCPHANLNCALGAVFNLVAHGADLNQPCGPNDEFLPACMILRKKLLASKADVVKFFGPHANGMRIKINLVENGSGETPLHCAIERNDEDAIECLLEHNRLISAFLNIQDKKGRTPLHWAVSSGWLIKLDDRLERVKKLVKLGACCNIKDAEGHYPVDLAQDEEIKQIVKLPA